MNQLKLISWAAGALVTGVLVWIVNGWRIDANQLPIVEKELNNERATIAQIRADAKVVAAASAGYQFELTVLRERAASAPNFPVRLCRAAPAARVQIPATEPGLDGGIAAAGVVPRGDGEDSGSGPDIGPALRALADRADQVTAQARGLQNEADGLAPQ